MLQYTAKICCQFNNLATLSKTVLKSCPEEGESVIACIDPVVYQVLGITSEVGRFLLAQGMVRLAQRLAEFRRTNHTCAPEASVAPDACNTHTQS